MMTASASFGRGVIEFLRPGVAAYREGKRYLLRRLGLSLFQRRKRLASRYLTGEGIEVGALHAPLPVSNRAKVRYVDHISREECLKRFPDLDPSKIVRVDYISDGFTLEPIADGSQDFLIANHVLEHSPNPIGGLLNWSRVLKPRGILFFSVPLAKFCFDRGRALTSLEHFVEDHRLYQEGNTTALRERNRDHYREWRQISERNMCLDDGRPYPQRSAESEEKWMKHVLDTGAEIHFHTFSMKSLRRLVKYYADRIDRSLRVLRIVENESEAVVLLRKR